MRVKCAHVLCELTDSSTAFLNFLYLKVYVVIRGVVFDQCQVCYSLPSLHHPMPSCTKSTNKPHKLTHFQYTSWPDHGVPIHPSSLIKFVQEVRKMHAHRRALMVVHCRSREVRNNFLLLEYNHKVIYAGRDCANGYLLIVIMCYSCTIARIDRNSVK